MKHLKLDSAGKSGDQALPFFWAGFALVRKGSNSIPPCSQRFANNTAPTQRSELIKLEFASPTDRR